jgi:hypothetical protein
LYSVHFTDNNIGCVVGQSGIILKTTNGGTNWNSQASGTTDHLYSVLFIDNNTGWVVGGSWVVRSNGIILKTTDGGTNWLSQTIGTGNLLQSVHFTDQNAGWAVGVSGTILKLPSGTSQTSGTTEDLKSVYFNDQNTGWAVGENGTILNTTNGGVTFMEEGIGELPNSYNLTQNYPNPFNPKTTIKYDIPELSFVTLKVFDVLGREVITSVNEEKPVGNYETKFDATSLPSGIYFYRLQGGSFVETKKMVLLK